MKHTFKYFACLFVAILCFGQVWAADYVKVTSTADITDGDYLIVYETGNCAFNGALTALDAVSNKISVTITEGKIASNETTDAAKFTIDATAGTLKAASGKYIGVSSNSNGLKTSDEASTYAHTFAIENGNASIVAKFDGSTMSLRFNKASNQDRFRYYKNAGQEAIQLYKLDAGGSTKTLSSVAVSGTPTKTSYYAGDNFDPAGLTVTGTYSDASTAPITSGITWSYDPSQELALNQTSIGVIATVSNIASPKFNVSISVTEAPAGATYEKVTSTGDITDGDYLIVYEDGKVALNGALTSLDAVGNTVDVTINDGVITGSVAIDAATVTISTTAKTIQTASGYYIGITSYGNGLASSTSNAYEHQNISIDGGNAVIYFQQESWNSNKNGKMQLCYNSGSDQRRFRYFKEGSQKAIQLYKKVDGSTIKPSAELSYATADQKKLTKWGETFTAPTLVNPYGVAVTYASSAESVATVAANGAVTINAAGVATITASYDGSGDYKEGSASYTICVVSHAGTEADPYDVADARNVIDALGTKEGVYMSGKVSQITTAYDETYHNISFDISADGTTAVDQVRAFRCKGLGNTDFTSEDDVKTGATVTVYGNLTKYNSTYEFEAGCYLKAYEAPTVPKTSIANTKETAYTVAQAITYAADGVTYDLTDYVYVSGVVYDVKSFNSTNGTLDIYIKDNGASNQFELFKCAGINDGSSTSPFEALTDVQVGDEVIGYGQLTVYNSMSEFKQGNYLVELTRPTVAVTSVSLPTTESVEVGKTVTLTATVLPDNASDKSVTWTVESGSDKASVDNGTVTGVAEGTAVIRATSVADGTKYAECTVTVTAAAVLTDYYEKVTATADITDGTYLIVYEEGSLAFNGGLATLDAESNTIAVVITSDKKIGVTEQTAAATFYIDATAGTIKSASDHYIGVSSWSNGLKQTDTYVHNVLEIDGDKNAQIGIYNADWNTTGGTMRLQYNKSSGQTRFRYYKNGGQQPIALYKLHGEAVKPASGLAWNPADDIELTVGDAFTAPTLLNPNNIASADITIASDNEDLATVSNGVVSLVENATGTATITATFAGNETYKAANVSYTITVNPAEAPASSTTYRKVTATTDITDGEYLIVYETTSVAFNGALETLDAEGNSIAVTINEGVIAGTTAIDAAVFTIDVTAGTLQSASGRYIGVSSNSNGLKQTEDASTYTHTFSIDEGGNAVISANFDGSTMKLRYNPSTSSGNLRFRYYKNDGQQPIQLYKKESATPPTPDYGSYPRNGLTVGNYGTICLPNGGTISGAKLYDLEYFDGSYLYFLEVNGNAMEAGRPYVFLPSGTSIEVTYTDNVNAAAGSFNGLVGSYTQETITPNDGNYILYQNKYCFVNSTAYVGANRAYIHMDGVPTEPSTPQVGQAPRRRISMGVQGEQVATGILDIETGEQPMKVMMDGKLYIIRAGQLYDMTGRKVK